MRWGLIVLLLLIGTGTSRALEIVVLTGPAGSVAQRSIGPAIARVIEPIATRYGHDIRIETSSGTAETLRRCGAARRYFCIGIALPGVSHGVPEHALPLILRSDLDLACATALTRPGRFTSFLDALRPTAGTPFAVRPESDAAGLLESIFRLTPALEGERPVLLESRWPSDRLGLAARRGGIALEYGFPDPESPLAGALAGQPWEALPVLSPRLAERLGAFRLAPRVRLSEDTVVRALCAPAILVASDPDQIDIPAATPEQARFIRQDLRQMLEAIDWSVATDFARQDRGEVFPAADGAFDDWATRVCAMTSKLFTTLGDAESGRGALVEAVRRLGIRAIKHSSGRLILSSGGAYIAGTIGFPAATVAVLGGPVVPAVGAAVTVIGFGISFACQITGSE